MIGKKCEPVENKGSEKVIETKNSMVLSSKEHISTNLQNPKKNTPKTPQIVSNVSKWKKVVISTGNEGQLKKGSENEQNISTSSYEGIPRRDDNDLLNKGKSVVGDVFQVSNVSNVSNVSKNSTAETFETRNIVLQKALGLGNLDIILGYFFTKKEPISTEKVGEDIGKTKDIVRTTINRNKEYFQEVRKEDGKKLFELSILGMNYCKKKIDNYEKKIEIAQKQLEEEGKKKLEHEEIVEETKKIIIETKPKKQGNTMLFDFNKISEWSPKYADELLGDPIMVIDTIKDELSGLGIKEVRFNNLPKTQLRTAESLRCKDIDKLLVVEGRCVSLSSPRPVVTHSKYECPSCGTITTILQTESKVQEPSRCSCGRRGGFKLLSEDLEDSSNVVVEDLQDNTDNPNTQRMNARIQNWLVENEHIGVFNLGDEVRVTGILRSVRSFDRGTETTNRGYLFEILDAEKKEEEVVVENFTEEELVKIKEVAKEVDRKGISEIAESFAPDVHGYSHIKNAIILQACNRKNKPESSSTRNKQNILLIGDPGIAKSVLCKFAMAVTPGSRKASGGGSSAVGITASVVKEDESMGGYRIEAGALPLAKELLFLDEMNNLTEDDKPKLQEAMSEQVISINKANLHVNLKVTAGVLATANPMKGHFYEDIPYNKQFNIPSPILNRFDVIFIMKDTPNKDRDEAIADIMIKRKRGGIKPKYSISDLKKFFAYVRSFDDPEISDDIAKKLREIYSHSRNNKNTDVIINPRFIEALNRMIEASAKLRLSKHIEEKDITRAMNILKESHFKTNKYSHFNFDEGKLLK